MSHRLWCCLARLNRLELSHAESTRYRKITADTDAIEALLVALFLDTYARPPAQITLDLDATDDPLHSVPFPDKLKPSGNNSVTVSEPPLAWTPLRNAG